MTETDRYAPQKRYFAKTKAKAGFFDHFNRLRVGRIRSQIEILRRRGAVDDRLERLLPFYLSFPQCQTVIVPQLSEDVRTKVRSYLPGPDPYVATWVAHGDDWDIGVAAYAFSRQFPDEPFRFVGVLRGRDSIKRGPVSESGDMDFYYDPEAEEHESLLRENGLWVTE